jgi:hypothetical protein
MSSDCKFEKLPAANVTQAMVVEAAKLFSSAYGVWGPLAEAKMGPFAKQGSKFPDLFSFSFDDFFARLTYEDVTNPPSGPKPRKKQQQRSRPRSFQRKTGRLCFRDSLGISGAAGLLGHTAVCRSRVQRNETGHHGKLEKQKRTTRANSLTLRRSYSS